LQEVVYQVGDYLHGYGGLPSGKTTERASTQQTNMNMHELIVTGRFVLKPVISRL
jgi:hypothetical protein